MKKSKIVSEVVKYELAIWQQAYPNSKKVLEKFANKIIYELAWRVKDPIMAKGSVKEKLKKVKGK